MKAIAILNALDINDWAFKGINGKQSAVERAVDTCLKFESVDKVAILTDCKEFGFKKADPIMVTDFSSKTIFKKIYETYKDYDVVFFASCDAPFLDSEIASELLKVHIKYSAEYTIADGFPKGLAPEVLDIGLVNILSSISNLENVKLNRTFVFECLKQNINSYDIETIIAPVDLQYLRLEFFANNKRNFLLCSEFEGISCKNYQKFIFENEKKLFTLPAFYAIEISAKRSLQKIYLPNENTSKESFMSFESFKIIVDKIVEYSDDSVISFSILGEPFLNAELLKMIEYCFKQKNISLLLETDGLDFDEKQIIQIKNITEKYSDTSNGKLFWIVCLDSSTSEMYAKVSNIELNVAENFFKKASENILTLYKYFGENVFAQFTRIKENEDELEIFYRNWKEKINNPLIQKHDNFAGQITDRRVADLSPIIRNVCWHLKRDMFILTDGTVLLCKEDILKKVSFGNIFSDDIKTIRENIFKIYLEHVNKIYKGLCETCDEYYTYNF